MYSPDLIQRIYFEKKNGDERNFIRVFSDLRKRDVTFISGFDFNGKTINWTCFESKQYEAIIMEDDSYIYFYLRDESLEFEVIIPGHFYDDKKNKSLMERTHNFHCVWVIGSCFPGLESFNIRPIKINLPRVKGRNCGSGSISNLNWRFKQTLSQYESLSQPIFEPIDNQKHDDIGKPWRKLVDKKK